MSNFEILGVPQSNYTRAVRMACVAKGIDYKFTIERPHSEAVSAIHPFGKIPVLKTDTFTLAESEAIARWIDATFEGPALFPNNATECAQVNQWLSLTNSVFDRTMIRQYLFAYIFPKTNDGSPDRKTIDNVQEDLAKQLGIIDAQLGKSAYIGGVTLSFADMNLYPILDYLGNLPESSELIKASKYLPAYIQTMATKECAIQTVPPKPSQ